MSVLSTPLKHLLARSLVGVLSKSYYVTELARLIVQSYDNDCNADMYKNGEVNLIKMIQSTRGCESIFFDVGANKGEWSIAALKNGAGMVILVDPLRRNLEIASRQLSALNLNNWQLCEYALSDKKERVKFFVNKNPNSSGTDSLYDMRRIGYNDDLQCVMVQCITLDELVDELEVATIDFCKIDVEGHELSVLQGATSLLSSGSIRFIQIEFGHAARAAGVYLHDIVQFVDKFDYKMFVIKPFGLLPLRFSPFTENRYSYINFLIANKDVLGELGRHVLRR